MFERILVPLDGSRRAEQALPIAARLARASRGTIVLLRVVSIPNEIVSYLALEPIPTRDDIGAAREEARNYLDGMATGRSLVGIHSETEVILGQAAAAILSAVNAHHIDLIVLCSHGYTGLTRWFVGSVAEKVVHHSPVPVLVLREGGPLPVGPLSRCGKSLACARSSRWLGASAGGGRSRCPADRSLVSSRARCAPSHAGRGPAGIQTRSVTTNEKP